MDKLIEIIIMIWLNSIQFECNSNEHIQNINVAVDVEVDEWTGPVVHLINQVGNMEYDPI